MGKTYHLNVWLDPELERALEIHLEQSGLRNRSAVVRDLLRHSLGLVTSTREAGWHEGYNAAVGEVKKTLSTALSKIEMPISG